MKLEFESLERKIKMKAKALRQPADAETEALRHKTEVLRPMA